MAVDALLLILTEAGLRNSLEVCSVSAVPVDALQQKHPCDQQARVDAALAALLFSEHPIAGPKRIAEPCGKALEPARRWLGSLGWLGVFTLHGGDDLAPRGDLIVVGPVAEEGADDTDGPAAAGAVLEAGHGPAVAVADVPAAGAGARVALELADLVAAVELGEEPGEGHVTSPARLPASTSMYFRRHWPWLSR